MRTPKYRKHSTRDCAFVEWRFKRYYLPGVFNSPESREAYRKFISVNVYGPAASAPHDEPTLEGRKTLTVAGLAVAYLTYARARYKSDRGRGEYVNLRAVIKPFAAQHAGVVADKFGPLKLKRWMEGLAAGGKVSRSYINQQAAKLKRMFKWAASEELISAATYHAIATAPSLKAGESPARETIPRQPVAWEHIEPLLGELSPEVSTMLQFQWLTGARSGSIVRAKPEQFDTSGDLWVWHPRHKTEHMGEQLELFVGPRGQSLLKPFMREPGEYLFDPRRRRKNKRYSERYTTQSYAQAVARALGRVNNERAKQREKSGSDDPRDVPNWTPHQIRHAKGHDTRDKYGIEAQQATLGHKTLEAAQIYSARRQRLARKVAKETG